MHKIVDNSTDNKVNGDTTGNRLKMFLEISRAIVSTYDLDSLLQLIVDNATNSFNLGTGAIYLLTDSKNIRLAATTPALPSDFPEKLRSGPIEPHKHIRSALQSGTPVIVTDAEKESFTSEEQQIVELRKLRSILYLPVLIREVPIGILILSSIDEIHTFTPDEMSLLQGFADHSAHAIDNLRNYENTLKYSAELEKQIAERECAEKEHHKSLEKLKKVIETDTVGVMFWDLSTGCLTDANDTFLNLMGYTRSEMQKAELTWQKLTPPEYIEASLAEIEKFNEVGRVGPYEKEYLRKDGTRIWLVFAGSSLGENSCVEFCVDISIRKKIEEELRRERDFSNSALDSLPGVFYCFDEDRKFLRWNRNFELVTGYSGDEISQMNPHDFFKGTDKELLNERIKEVFEKGAASVEAQFFSKEGRSTPYFFTGVMTMLDGRKHLVGVGIDITEQRKTELKMAEQIEELQKWHDTMLDREDRVIELKKEVNDLLLESGKSIKYGI